MRIYVVRHGETEWNKEEIFRGRKDIPLNEAGKRQAEKVSLYFSQRHINRIVSSPLVRALQTAEPISKTAAVAVEAMEEFTDINFGIWEGLPLREVEERYRLILSSGKNPLRGYG
ncbi:MAG: histidine phosphatase family protein [Syntrophorhabdales bacterium]|jgi:broad specificity phosphatase PhoE